MLATDDEDGRHVVTKTHMTHCFKCAKKDSIYTYTPVTFIFMSEIGKLKDSKGIFRSSQSKNRQYS